MSNNPLAEVFGFPVNNFSAQAEHHRKHALCPFMSKLTLKNTVYTDYASVVAKYAPPSSGISPIDDFLEGLYKKLQGLRKGSPKRRKSRQNPTLPVVDADTIDTE